MCVLAVGADAGKYNVMGNQQEAVCLIDAFFQILEVGDRDIKDFSAALTAYMIVMRGIKIKSVGSVWNLNPKNFSLIGKEIQVAVNGALTDGWVLRSNLRVDLFRSGMVGHGTDCFKNQLFLNGISVSHGNSFR